MLSYHQLIALGHKFKVLTAEEMGKFGAPLIDQYQLCENCALLVFGCRTTDDYCYLSRHSSAGTDGRIRVDLYRV